MAAFLLEAVSARREWNKLQNDEKKLEIAFRDSFRNTGIRKYLFRKDK